MAINTPMGFVVTSTEPIDSRLVMSKNDMATYPSARMPDRYFCITTESEGADIYIYDETKSLDPDTGKFHPYWEYSTTVIKGYYNTSDGLFYKDLSHTLLLPVNKNQLYIDLTNSTYIIYICDGTTFTPITEVTTDKVKYLVDTIAAGATYKELTLPGTGIKLINILVFDENIYGTDPTSGDTRRAIVECETSLVQKSGSTEFNTVRIDIGNANNHTLITEIRYTSTNS